MERAPGIRSLDGMAPARRPVVFAAVILASISVSFAAGRMTAPVNVAPSSTVSIRGPAGTEDQDGSVIPDHGRVKWVTWD